MTAQAGDGSARLFSLAVGLAVLGVFSATGTVVLLLGPREEFNLASVAAGCLFTTACLSLVAAGLLVAQRQKAGTLRAQQDRRNRLIVDTAADAIITFTARGDIESANTAACQLFGYRSEEVIGQNISLLLAPVGSASIDSILRRNFQTGSGRVLPHGSLFEGLHKSGRRIPIELGVSKVLDEDRKIYIQIIRDLTERDRQDRQRQLQYDVARLLTSNDPIDHVISAVLGLIGQGMDWSVAVLWRVDRAGKMLRPISGWSSGTENHREYLTRALSREQSPGRGMVGRAWLRGEPEWTANLSSMSDLEGVPVPSDLQAVLVVPVQSGGQSQGAIQFHAPSLQVPGEQLAKIIYPMAAQLGQFLQRHENEEELRRAKEAAEAASEAKSQFLANVSHEVRTPLNGILGMIEVLLQSELTQQHREHILLVQTSAEMLLQILNDVLDFSKIEATRMDLEQIPFDVRASLTPTLKTLASRAVQGGLRFTWTIAPDIPPYLIGDPLRLQQIFLNLVGNAIKFTPHGEIDVTLSLKERSNDQITLLGTIRDTGIGIPPHKQQMIFEAFSQADASRSRKYGGTGLGLAITTRLVELMGGQVTVQSVPDDGSTFCFTARFVEASASSLAEPPEQHKGLRILVGEDNAVNRVLLDLILQKRHQVTTVSNGAEVLETFAREPFDLILLDVQMPLVDGWEVTRRLRERPGCPPIIGLSAQASEEDRQQAKAAGMDLFFSKPTNPEELLLGIDRLITSLSHQRFPRTGTRTGETSLAGNAAPPSPS